MKIGAHYKGSGTCEFTVWAPLKKSVSLHLFSPFDRIIPLERNIEGYWKVSVHDITPGMKYLYVLDGALNRPDPASHFQPAGVHGVSEVIDHSFPWTDDLWVCFSLADMIMYEIHVGTFTPEGTFEAAQARLSELVSLGVNAVELMPVTTFPGERNWGYDGVYPFSVHPAYGGPEGLKRFVTACHNCGIAVIMDAVYNHFGPEGNYCADFAPYCTRKYHTPWGDAVNYDDRYNEGVRNFFIENTIHWLREYHIDVLRLDAVHGIFDESPRHILADMSEAVENFSVQSGRLHYLVAESDSNDTTVIRPREAGGYGINAQWCDDFHHALHTLLTGEKKGYYADFGSIEELKKSFEEGFVYSGQYSRFRQKPHGKPSRDIPAASFIVFSQNHDQAGNRPAGERLSALAGFEALKLAAGAVFLSAYIPLIFMGEEYAEDAPFFYFVSHTDTDLIRSVQEGRKREFSAFTWYKEPLDPQDPGTFLRSKIDWDKRRAGKHKVMLDFYRQLIALRKEIPVLSHSMKDGMFATTEGGGKVLTVRRQFKDSGIVCSMNFDKGPVRIVMNPGGGQWRKRLDSSETAWLGPGSTLPESIGSEAAFVLNPFSFVLYERKDSS